MNHLVKHYGFKTIHAYMQYVQDNAEENVRDAIHQLKSGDFAYRLDNGAQIQVQVKIDKEACNAIIIGFNVVSEEHVAKITEARGVEIRLYNIIYRITEDLQKSMVGLLEPEKQEKSLGRATVRTIFKISKVGTVAGCYVSDGLVKKRAIVRLIRDNIVIRDGLTVDTLKHFKDDVREVKTGLECGIKIAKFDDIKVDDVLDFYEIIEVARTL